MPGMFQSRIARQGDSRAKNSKASSPSQANSYFVTPLDKLGLQQLALDEIVVGN